MSAAITRHPEHLSEEELSADVTVLNGTAYATAIPYDETGELVAGGIVAQSERVFIELARALEAAGSGLDRIAHLTIYLRDLPDTRGPFNEVYARVIPADVRPVRCAVGVEALAHPEMLVELTAVASASQRS